MLRFSETEMYVQIYLTQKLSIAEPVREAQRAHSRSLGEEMMNV